MTWKQLLWIVVIPSFLGHHRAAMRELWQQSKPCLGHWARARHDGTGGACVKTCWNRLRQVTHGFWMTVKQSLFCGATGLEVGWAELRVVSGAHSPSCWSFWGWEWFESVALEEWRNFRSTRNQSPGQGPRLLLGHVDGHQWEETCTPCQCLSGWLIIDWDVLSAWTILSIYYIHIIVYSYSSLFTMFALNGLKWMVEPWQVDRLKDLFGQWKAQGERADAVGVRRTRDRGFGCHMCGWRGACVTIAGRTWQRPWCRRCGRRASWQWLRRASTLRHLADVWFPS